MRTTHCICGCSNKTVMPVAAGWYHVPQRDRGGRAAYMCPSCAELMGGYSFENTQTVGTPGCGGGFTYSIEFETNNPTHDMQAYMLKNKWACTSDCTVDAEYKSPIFQSLNSPKKLLVTLEQMQANGDFSVGSNCGTHFNVGVIDGIGAWTMDSIRERYGMLFGPLSDYLAANPEKCGLVFGRPLNPNGWAVPYRAGMSSYEHTLFVNCQHNTHLEFRAAKFRTAAQYMHMAKMCKEIVKTILTRYDDTAASACKVGTRLVAIFEKYAETAPRW